MTPRRAFVMFVVAALLASCTGDRRPAPAASGAELPTIASSPRARLDGGLPAVRMQAGTDSVKGKLVRSCTGERCEARGGLPARAVELAENRLLLFVAGAEPTGARVEVRRRLEGRVARREVLRPGTVMPYHAALRPGSYVVTLQASWGRKQGQWLFSLRVPRDVGSG